MSDPEPHPKPEVKSACRNCGHAFDGDYCPSCGQRDIDFRKDWRSLIEEYAASMFNFDGKVPRGILQLLLLPGYATQQYLAGRRASQIPPVRLYLFASLVFFLWLGAAQDKELREFDPEIQAAGGEGAFVPQSGSGLAEAISERYDNPEAFRGAFNAWLPRVFLFGVPLLALLTRLLFRKRELVYLEHLILSMHLQTFALLWLLLLAALAAGVRLFEPDWTEWIWKVLLWWLPIYPVLALRRVFDLSWSKSIGATVTIEALYAMLLLGGVVLGVYLTIWIG